ncbi:MAG: ATP-binding protein [Pseudomonadota bacterium]|jgi:signal transduction histidine kinase/CheY-like chemotaxis protein
MAKSSLSRDFLIRIGMYALGITLLATVAAFFAFQQGLAKQEVTFLADYVRERSANVERRFSNLTALHEAASRELQWRMRLAPPAVAERLFNEYYPLRPDGSRRSKDADFDGVMEEDGDHVYGMGALITQPQTLTVDDRRLLASVFPVVAAVGVAARAQYDNIYFFMPPVARLVMFAPDRPDRLMFYRHTAPANLDVSKFAMANLVSPENDPTRATVCTDLQRLVQDTTGPRQGTACMTPAYIEGRYVGAFGSSIDLSGFLTAAVDNPLPDATGMIMTRNGATVSGPPRVVPAVARHDPLSPTELKRLAHDLSSRNADYGVTPSSDGRQLIAYSKLKGPNWYYLLVYPRSAVITAAAKSASFVLVIGLLAAAAQTGLILFYARRAVVRPLEQLASQCDTPRTMEGARLVEQRMDEIGALARALRDERKRADEALNSLETRVRERTAELERATNEKSRFLANMSHELRTPLNGIIAVSQALAARQTAAKDRELGDLIVSSGRLLEKVLSDVLDFSKIEAGEVVLSDEVFDLKDLVRRIGELHRAAAEAKGLQLLWHVELDALGAYRGDTVRITQVLSNLLSNAVKFTERGAVKLRARLDDEMLVFSVADTGIGFDAATSERLFRRFEQADSSIRRRFGGTGLGLAISRALVELMGGRIVATSTPGVGSQFEVLVPLPRAAAEPSAATEPAAKASDLSHLRVLLAEDHPTNQKVVQIILEPFGVQLDIVANGAQALERFAAQHYDAVLMDMQMPEMDGIEATRRLRDMERADGSPRTPVVMLTANALDEHVRASFECGADLHLTKPISAEELVSTLAAVTAGGGFAQPVSLDGAA